MVFRLDSRDFFAQSSAASMSSAFQDRAAQEHTFRQVCKKCAVCFGKQSWTSMRKSTTTKRMNNGEERENAACSKSLSVGRPIANICTL